MWRQRNFAANSDSDQSISDAEEVSLNLGGNDVSFGGNVEKNASLQLQSRLEMLRGKDHLHSESEIGIVENEIGLFNEDEVEMPEFPDEGGFTYDGIVAVNENNCDIAKRRATIDAKSSHEDKHTIKYEYAGQDEACAWYALHEEAETLICMNNDTSPSSSAFRKANKYRKGIMGKVKPKFSFHFQSHNKAEPSKYFISKADDGDHLSNEFRGLHGQPNTNIVQGEDSNREDGEQNDDALPRERAVGHSFVEHSMAEILDGLQDRNNLPRRISKMPCRTRESRGRLLVTKSVSLMEKTAIAHEDQPELVSSGSSSDDDAYYQNAKVSGLEMKRQSMVDRFHDALSATSLDNEGNISMIPKLSSLGLSGKLQLVMQREKDRDTDFLKKLQDEAILKNESHSIVVKILSKHLEAKLTVCHCSVENSKGNQWLESSEVLIKSGRKRKVIFNPRVCSDVEFEVGNLIRIHHPWKDIQLKDNDESVILSTYFSQIYT